jgi:hypothetical protein
MPGQHLPGQQAPGQQHAVKQGMQMRRQNRCLSALPLSAPAPSHATAKTPNHTMPPTHRHPHSPSPHLWLRLSTTGVRRSASSGATTAAQRRAVTTSALLRADLQTGVGGRQHRCAQQAVRGSTSGGGVHALPQGLPLQCRPPSASAAGVAKAGPEWLHHQGAHLILGHVGKAPLQVDPPAGHQVGHLLKRHLQREQDRPGHAYRQAHSVVAAGAVIAVPSVTAAYHFSLQSQLLSAAFCRQCRPPPACLPTL